MFGVEWSEEQFRGFCVETYKCFGQDVMIDMLTQEISLPFRTEWLETRDPNYIADCYLMLSWLKLNDLTSGRHKYYFGTEWSESEGWR